MVKQQAKIGHLIYDNAHFLRALARSKSITRRKRLLKQATPDHLLALVEICLNILCASFRLTSRQKQRLAPHADFVRRLSRKRTERGARHFLVQKGSGIGGLFGALLAPILLEVAKAISKKN